ncbi:MAG: HTH-type transcriptional regulator DdrOC [Deltaproteobacteria bacterium]|nr:HTH-type transcriptional regulator DdrOC [Deltaproteobacteria bacterium]
MCNMELRRKFGKRLKLLRKYRGLTQEQLAERLELSVEMVSFMERGIHAPSFETLSRLAEVLSLPVRDLFDFERIVEK